MVDIDKVMVAMNAGDASKISPVMARAMKKKALAEALAAKKIEAAKKQPAKVVPMKKPEAKKAAALRSILSAFRSEHTNPSRIRSAGVLL
jgi:hypothetical protein